jgi:hypothetical protein
MHQGANVTTRCTTSVAHGQNGPQLGERETHCQCPLNEFHPLRRRRRIFAVISGRALRQGQEPQALVVPQRIRADAREMGQLSRTHGRLPPREESKLWNGFQGQVETDSYFDAATS